VTKIKEGYDIPTDLKHVSKPWAGLSHKHAFLLLVCVVLAYGWWKLVILWNLPGIAFKIGFIALGVFAVCAVWLELDLWMYRFAMWWVAAPYYVTRFDSAAKQVSGIISITTDHYWNVDGHPCAALQLTALNSDRIDPAKADEVLKFDKDFLNAVPCPFQIAGYTRDYKLDGYISDMLSYADNLPKKVMAYKIAHLNFYQQYIKDNNIRERGIYLIIKSDPEFADPIETLNTNMAIITKNLAKSGVIGRRLVGSEISDLMIMIATGVGSEGVDYLNPYTEVEA